MDIKILANFLRYNNGLSMDQRWLENILTLPIEAALSTSISPMSDDILKELYNAIYNEYNIHDINKNSWVDIYTKEPTEIIIQMIKNIFADSFVIAFEIHPVIQKAFDKLKIKYIKLMNHPVRYMDDIFFGMTSNIQSVHEKILKYQTNEFLFKQKVGILKAESSVNEFVKRYEIKENSCIFFAQTNIDCSLIDGNKLYNFFDFKDEFLKDIESYEHVYFKIHPCEVNSEAVEFVKTIDKVSVLYPDDINFYDLISSPKIKKCFAISSGSLYEAKLFGKDVKYYFRQPFMFVTDYKDNNYPIADTFVPIYKTFYQPKFWADILSDYFEPKENIPEINENYSNRIRCILKMTWGYCDSNTVYQYLKNNFYEQEIRNLWSAMNRKTDIYSKHNKLIKFVSCIIPVKNWRRNFRNKYMK